MGPLRGFGNTTRYQRVLGPPRPGDRGSRRVPVLGQGATGGTVPANWPVEDCSGPSRKVPGHGQQDARGRRVAGEGEDDREVPGRRLRRPGFVWAHPGPGEGVRRPGRRCRARFRARLRRARGFRAPRQRAEEVLRAGPTTSSSRRTTTARARRSRSTSPRCWVSIPPDAKRVTFTEITRDAILEAFRAPREIDLQLFDAQEARRILDRLVGFRISPILWKRVRPGLSAGRVQSVAVRLIVEREREIRAFTPVEYWSVDVRLTPDGAEQTPFTARLNQIPDGKLATAPDKKGVLLGGRGRRRHPRRATAPRELPGHEGRAEGTQAFARLHRSPPRPCSRKRRASSGSALARRCRWPSVSTKASTCRARAGRTHHLHADRLGHDQRHGPARDRRAGEDRLRRRVRARRVPPVQDEVARTRRRRTKRCGRPT